MNLKYFKNIQPAVDGMQKVGAISWSPNGKKLAICGADRVVQLFDDQGTKKDKFSTKPSEKGQKSYVVRAIEFSPDSQKVAVAQSDNIVYIYKIGTEFGDKKSICNKFPTSSSVTCMTWPKDRHNEIIIGLAEGKVKVGVLKNNKSQVVYDPNVYCVSLASSRDGNMIISGHLDGQVYIYNLDSQQSSRIFEHHSIPYALGFGQQIVAAGNDGKVTFYDYQGNFMQRFDYTNDDRVKEFTVASMNPSGDTVVLGNYNRFYIYNFNKRRSTWEEIGVKLIENYYTVTALCWKPDGSKLTTGSLCGSVDVYDASMKKIKYKGKFELNYVSPSQIVVKSLSNGQRFVIKTDYSPEITRINVLQDRFVVANTMDSIVVGDLQTEKVSEILFRGSGNEKFDFSNPNICMIYNAGELTLVELGNNEPLGICRTEYVKPYLISARINYSEQNGGAKIIAYLLDQQTICIQDLSTQSQLCQITNDSKIDFIELNAHANKLLFRDKRRQLYLYNLRTQNKNTLLNFCSYAQWVPDSEVVVAQNRNNLCVWYSIENPDKVTIYNIKGDVEEIQRVQGKTEVIVNEGSNTVAYTLDEPLIDFGFAVESRDLEKAAAILDPLEMNSETEANWRTLAQIAVEDQNITVAEHCYAALGDIAKAKFLRGIVKQIRKYEQESGQKGEGIKYYKVQAKLAQLDKQFHQAEAILLDHDEVEDAMEMYQELHKWDDSIKIAEKKNHPQVAELKSNYYQWLLDTNQDAKAAEIKEHEGQFLEAIKLYLKGGVPAKAAHIVFNYNANFPQDLLENIAQQLTQAGMYEKAGDFYEQMDMLQKALDCHCKGNAYGKAVELAKRCEPRLVVRLEEMWGDYLCSQKQTENAVNHYIEAGIFQKAIEAAIQSRQWNKAIQLLQGQSPELSRPFYKQIARHYASIRQLDLAEKYFLKAGQPVEAFESYIKANKWEQALRVAKDNLPENDIIMLYVKQGQKFEEQGKYKEAERLYLTVDEPDQAINMYKKAAQFDNMIRLVSKYRKNLLKDTHLAIAQKFEHEGNLKSAEHHYIESGAWHAAVEMYKQNSLWEEALRVTKQNGSDKETCEMAKKWAETLGPEQGMKMLLKMNLVDVIIEYMMDRQEFDEAFKTAQNNAKHKLAEVHLKYAMYLEDEKRFKEAEEHYIKAGKQSEAINMYESLGDFQSAIQVARQYEPQSLPQIYLNQARFFIERRDYVKAENAFISAKKPEIAIKMYTDMANYHEALRVAKKHAPHLVNEINNKAINRSDRNMTGEDLLNSAKLWEETRDYQRAIDTYLEIRKEHFPSNPDLLEQAWERAYQLAFNFDKERCLDVVNIVCQRLNDIRRFETSAELFENMGLYEEAVETYIQGKLFEKAKQCASQVKQTDLNRRLMELINKHYKNYLKQENQADELINQGDVVTGLDMMAERGDWKNCLDSAERSGKEVLNKYLMRFAKYTMEQGQFGQTIEAFAKYGLSAIPQNYSIYKTLILEIFVDCDPTEIAHLRASLFDFNKQLQAKNEHNSPAGKEFKKYLTIAHLLNLKTVYQKKSLPDLYAKLCVSLLRYSDLIRLDKLYYDAGIACKNQNQYGLAFTLLNRYLDIYEVIQDPDQNLGDNSQFENTDIPSPFDVPLPDKNLIGQQDKEKISEWILQISINQQVQQSLPTRSCEQCNAQIFDGSLRCYQCKYTSEPCIVSGYPLLKGHTVQCKSCNNGALRDQISIYQRTTVNCPWCSNMFN